MSQAPKLSGFRLQLYSSQSRAVSITVIYMSISNRNATVFVSRKDKTTTLD